MTKSLPCTVVFMELLSSRLHCNGSVGGCTVWSVPASVFCSVQMLKAVVPLSGAVTTTPSHRENIKEAQS